MKLEVTQEGDIHIFKFIKDGIEIKKVSYKDETYQLIANHFKSKKAKKQPAPAPKIEDVKEYFKLKGYSNEAACKFYEYYDTTGWRGANNAPILNWKGKALAVWFVDKNKIKENTSTSSFFR